jgi:hypothetical protein
MKKFALITLFVALLVVGASTWPAMIAVFAAVPMSEWPFFVEVTPPTGRPGMRDLVVPLQVLDKSREDLADLRLYDAQGTEIPYALRILREVNETQERSGRLFNQASVGSAASEVSVDLGENAGEHNEVEIETSGTNFRRRVDLEGSDSGTEWRTLKSGGVILSVQSQNRAVELNRVNYPTSRYRYLRVRVFADELTDKQAPTIAGVKVTMAVRQQGELTTWPAAVPPYELLRREGAPASSWTIDLGGHVPCDRLILEIDNESFSRPFLVEAIDDPDNIRLVTSGTLTRRIGEERHSLVIIFDKEERTRKLRLVINDYSNQLLTITGIKAAAPARQLVFEKKEASAEPLRLFLGNPNATAPHYDFETDLPARSRTATSTAPARSEVGQVADNPDYRPTPLPLTERIPWLIYVVLAASSLALAIILVSLARTTLRGGAEQTKEAASSS